MNETRKQAPKGQFRVIGIDMFANEDYYVGDFNTKEEALAKLKDKNENAYRQGSLPDKYYTYNDKGEYIG